MPGFRLLHELRRRHVIRVVVAYAIVGWGLVQIATQVFPYFRIPDWSVRLLVLLVLAGFPVALVLAWAFDATPQGVRRTDVEGQPARRHARHGTLAMGVVGVLIAIVVGAGYWWWHGAPAVVPASKVAAAAAKSHQSAPATVSSMAHTRLLAPTASVAIPAKSVAVLPFENLSTDKANAYFADGMQDLILTKLADIGDLKVISRTSTEQYGSHPGNLRKIGRELSVATVLEGSVQKAGKQVLINVQLINAKTDSHIWAKSYTRTLDNIFGVEGEVAEKVATALNAKLTAQETARVAKVPTRNAAAYDAFLKGEYYAKRAQASLLASTFAKAEDYYQQAVRQDPTFILAWARLAYVSAAQTHFTFTGNRQPIVAAQAKVALDHALALAPDSPNVRFAQGWYQHWIGHDLKKALASFDAVLAVQPNDANALFGAGIMRFDLGHYRKAAELLRRATQLSPRDANLLTALGMGETAMRNYQRAQKTLRHALALDPDSALALGSLVRCYFLVGDPDGAKVLLDTASAELQDNPALLNLRTVIALQRRDLPAARKAAARMHTGGTYGGAFANSWRGDVAWLAGNRVLARQYYQRAASAIDAEAKQRPDDPRAHRGLAWIQMRLGKAQKGLARLQHAIQIASKRDNVAAVDGLRWEMARMFGQLGNAKAAVAILNDLMSRPSNVAVTAASLKIDWVWDPIRKDPRFQALLKKYGKSAPAAAASVGIGHD